MPSLFFLLGVFLFGPISGEAVASPSVKVQIRKLELQIKKLKLILADLQKVSTPKTDSVKPAKPIVAVKPIIVSPVIETISPDLGDDRTVFTITGANFDFSGNKIKTTYHTIDDISSPDGQTLVFSLGLFSEVFDLLRSNSQAWSKSANLSVNLWVENSHGQSNQVIFYLKFKP